MGADAQLILELSMNFFRRNNPLEMMTKTISTTVTNLLTFNSKVKLLNYKLSLANEQLKKMETHIYSGGSRRGKGDRLDRAY